MGDKMPAWFASWSTLKFDPFVTTVNSKLEDLSTRIAALEVANDRARDDLDSVKSSLAAVKDWHMLSDSCEVRITGVPNSFAQDIPSAVRSVFEATNNLQNLNFVSSCRAWPAGQSSTAIPSASSDTMSVVVKLVSPTVRNNVIAQSALLKGKTSRAVFGTGGGEQVFMRPLWPQPTYQLLRLAIPKAKELGYLKPVVRNLVVCMRAEKNAPLTPVYSSSDQAALVPRLAHQ